MRKQTLAVLCSLLGLAIVFGLKALADWQNIRIPLFSYVSPLAVSILLLPILMALLTWMNKHILSWRKARERDIEEEERYENVTADIISLRPTQPDTELSYKRR
jgi:hypothetical protein